MTTIWNHQTHKRLARFVELGMQANVLELVALAATMAGKDAQRANVPHSMVADLMHEFINDARIEIMREQKNGNGA
jgi:hypothetical protein